MERYFKKRSELSPPKRDDPSKEARVEINLNELEADPGLRKKITSYHPDDQDIVRRAYWLRGPCQPNGNFFPSTQIGVKLRRFNPAWYNDYKPWLEYSKAKDSLFCLCCYLFKVDVGQQSGGDSFVGEGFRNWKKKDRLDHHVGHVNNIHYQAWCKCKDLLNQEQHTETAFFKQSNQARIEYRARLNASINCVRLLLRQGLPLRGHDESENSENQGNFLEVLQFLADHNEEVRAVVLKNAPENLKLTSPEIQKNIINACAVETINAIIKDIGDECFSILVDESRDVSIKEQMAVVLRYVNDKGNIVECFLGVEHVTSTTVSSLKTVIDAMFSRHGLSISKLRGQGYDGASNMKGEFNGLKTMILRDNECAYYIHCFAHQLQLALVAVAKNHSDISWFFNSISSIVNVVGGSCRRHDTLREIQAKNVYEALNHGELPTGRGLNQETSLARASDTRWGSHYATLISLINMYSTMIKVLEMIRDDGVGDQKGVARGLLFLMHQFDFIFNLHLMKTILAITNELSLALQRKDQDIVNAMLLVEISVKRLNLMRNSGWDTFLEQVSSFCCSHGIDVPIMDDLYLAAGRSRRGRQEITNLHHYRVDSFCNVLDMRLQALNDRFTESTTELLRCVACLSPAGSFSAFDKQKLIRLASFYPNDFSSIERMVLEDQLNTYIFDMRGSSEFLDLKGLGDLNEKLVHTKRSGVYQLVYRLLKLALVLPVATATVERAFSAMKILKTRLRNRMGDNFLNDTMIVYIERKKFNEVSNDAIMQRFQKMKSRREQL